MKEDVAEYIERKYLGGKRLTKNTRNTIRALVNAYGNEVVFHEFIKKENENWLVTKKYNNQAHFESAVLFLLKKNAPYMKKSYERDRAELLYDSMDEPPILPAHEQYTKEIKKWVF